MVAKDAISVVLSALALLVSLSSFAFNYMAADRNAILSRKPVLIFEYQDEVGWELRNIGSGPALNIVVAQRAKDGKWFNPVRVPPLSKDGKFVLKWLGHVNTTDLGSLYSDSEELKYTAICENDSSNVFTGLRFGPWQEGEIGKHWSQPLYKRKLSSNN